MNIKIKKKIQKNEFAENCYLLAYSIFVARVAIGNTTFLEYFSIYGINLIIAFITGMVLIGIKMFIKDKYSLKTILFMLSMFLLFGISYCNNSYSEVIIFLLLILGIKGIDFDKIVTCHFFVYASIMVLSIICALFGIIENYSVYEVARGYRYALGNTYPTDFAAGMLYLLLDFWYIKRKDWKFRYTVFWAILSYITYEVTDGKTTFMLASLVLMLTVIYQVNSGRKLLNSNFVRMISAVAFPLFACISIIIQATYGKINNVFLQRINGALNNRIAYGYEAIEEYGIPLFGTRVEMYGGGWNTSTSEKYFYVDNGYLQLTLLYGLVLLASLCIGFSVIVYNANRYEGEYRCVMSLSILVLAVSGLIEPRFYNILYSSFVMLLGIRLFQKDSKGYHIIRKIKVMKKRTYFKKYKAIR